MRCAARAWFWEPSVARCAAHALECHRRSIPDAARHNWQQKSRRDENEFVSCQCSLDLQVKQARRDGLSAALQNGSAATALRSATRTAVSPPHTERPPAPRPPLGQVCHLVLQRRHRGREHNATCARPKNTGRRRILAAPDHCESPAVVCYSLGAGAGTATVTGRRHKNMKNILHLLWEGLQRQLMMASRHLSVFVAGHGRRERRRMGA